MTHAELICRGLWQKAVKYRDRWCLICGLPVLELLHSHHIWFLSSGNWRILFDTDFGVTLCGECHEEKPYAPHINNELFLEMIIPRIHQADPDRAAKVIEFLNSPKEPCTERPDYKKIAAGLRVELKNNEDLYWMNQDIEPYARVAVI